MLDDLWEDCTLIDLLKTRPTIEEAEHAYRECISGILTWHTEYEPKRLEAIKKHLASLTKDNYMNPPEHPIPLVGPGYFLDQVFAIYEDIRDSRPRETLLLTYARMLNPNDAALLEDLKQYRNDLFELEKIKGLISVPNDWKIGDL
jgi:hypothetical protein